MKFYNFNALARAISPALGCPYTISNGDGGKYPKRNSKWVLSIEV